MQPQCLSISNKSRHDDIACRTRAAIEELRASGERISFYSVAKRAQVSRSTLYRCDDLRALVEAARSCASRSAMPASGRLPDTNFEQQLAQVTRERDALLQSIREMSCIEYGYARLASAA